MRETIASFRAGRNRVAGHHYVDENYRFVKYCWLREDGSSHAGSEPKIIRSSVYNKTLDPRKVSFHPKLARLSEYQALCQWLSS